MMRQLLLLTTLVVALMVTGCATTTPYNPFKVAQDEFYGKVKTIALTPLSLPRDLEDPEPVKTKFELLIEAKLREAGFSIVPSQEYDKVLKRMTEQVGGYFDPITGKRDESKYKTVQEHTRRELNTKFKADAVLYSALMPVTAPFAAGTAKWHGTSESIQRKLETFLFGASQGTIGAMSLFVSIEDVNGVDMYANAGGIQVLMKLSGREFTAVPRSELFNNEERNAAAVNIALGSLVRKLESNDSSKAKP